MCPVDIQENQLIEEETEYLKSILQRNPTPKELLEFQHSLFCLGNAQHLYFQQKIEEENE